MEAVGNHGISRRTKFHSAVGILRDLAIDYAFTRPYPDFPAAAAGLK
jgi:hypothetical protein